MFLPKARAFWVSLNGMLDGKDITFWDGGSLQVFCPPSSILIINRHEKGIFWRVYFCKRVFCISAYYCHSFESSKRPKHPGSRLFHTASLCMCHSDCSAVPFATIASTASLWCSSILEEVGPHKRGDNWMLEFAIFVFFRRR